MLCTIILYQCVEKILDIFNLNIFMFNYSTRNMIMIFVNKKIKIVGTL